MWHWQIFMHGEAEQKAVAWSLTPLIASITRHKADTHRSYIESRRYTID
jgi:hypothetical protein